MLPDLTSPPARLEAQTAKDHMDLPRETALRALADIEERDVPLDQALEGLEGGPLDERDRRFVRQLVRGCITWRRRLDWIAQAFSQRPIDRAAMIARQALRLGVYQLLWLDRVPARAAVHSSVALAKKLGHQGLGAYVNAVLRRVAEDGARVAYPDSSKNLVDHLSVYHSHPPWLVRRWLSRWGAERAEALLIANNEQPIIYFRRNTLEDFTSSVPSPVDGQEAIGPLGDCYELGRAGGVFDSAAFRAGQLFVQDVNAGLPAALLQPQPGDTVLDVCSAPGGKTVQMAMLMGGRGRIVACDRSISRLCRVRENTTRLRLSSVTELVEDARRPSIRAPHHLWGASPAAARHGGGTEGFDRVLVDAPCSSTGVLRRRPDARWRRRGPQAILEHSRAQLDILRSAYRRVRAGGVVVYSTCTLEPEENEELVERFVDQTPGALVERADGVFPPSDWCGRFIQTLPGREAGDGCFAARIRRDRVEDGA